MLQPGRQNIGISGAENYRYGFQNQEIDDEVKGSGNSVNYEYRMHDPRLGRFFQLDPLMAEYPHNSPYAFSENVVINAIELEGLERKYTFNSVNFSDHAKLQLMRYENDEITYTQLVDYLDRKSAHPMSPATANETQYRLEKGYNVKEGNFRQGTSSDHYVAADKEAGTAEYIMIQFVEQVQDGEEYMDYGYDREESIRINNPDAPGIDPSAGPCRGCTDIEQALDDKSWRETQEALLPAAEAVVELNQAINGPKSEEYIMLWAPIIAFPLTKSLDPFIVLDPEIWAPTNNNLESTGPVNN